jgi:signal peptidase complex subunit 1
MLQAIAFLVGYVYQDVHLTVWIGLAGTLVTAIVVVPAWPFYNKHPEAWLVPGVPRTGITVGDVKVR